MSVMQEFSSVNICSELCVVGKSDKGFSSYGSLILMYISSEVNTHRMSTCVPSTFWESLWFEGNGLPRFLFK